ncbi:MAG TPA: alpha/beta fold hydrolase [Casimicrobiaceae bacterium]|nr:alpha/beta fold hydrolase [Casimicrobiaceae bacterium]
MNSPDVAAADAAIVEERVVVAACDGYPLGGTLYTAAHTTAVHDALVFNGGGGLACERYRHFLRFVATQGFAVLAYDYRGVGLSRPRRLRNFVAGLEDWSEFDQVGAIDWLRKRFPTARLSGISHSIGCVVASAAPNASTLSRMVYIGPHTGLWKDYRARWRAPMTLVWHVGMPLIARTLGYFPGRRLHLGDDMPLRFALQWAGRTTPEFRLDRREPVRATRQQKLLDAAHALRVPALVVSVFDDAFVSERAVLRFLLSIPSVAVERVKIEHDAVEGRKIGHFGFFGRHNAMLWPIATRFLRPSAK